MKITFLGTCHGYPEKNRDYPSILVEVGNSAYLIDAGGDVAGALIDRGIGFDSLRAVFITHVHGDHMNGLVNLVAIVSVPHYAPIANISYYLPEKRGVLGVKNYVNRLDGGFDSDKNKFFVYNEGTVYEDENIKLTAVPTGHLLDRGYPAYGFILESEGRRVMFSGDLSPNLKHNDFPDIVKREVFDLFVLELAHFDFEVVRPHLSDCLAKRVFINHVKFPSERIPLLDEENKSGKFPFEIIGANDGDTVIL